jgi:hypothetical protein
MNRTHLPFLAAAVPPLSTFSNVLAPPSGGRVNFDQQQLRILTAASTPTSQRIAALNVLAAQLLQQKPGALGEDISLPLFDTTAHCQIFEAVYDQVLGLSLGAYVGINGKPCRQLSGARGIGKTTMLRALVAVLSAAFPDVIFLYVTGSGFDLRLSSFSSMDLLSLMLAAAKECGVEADITTDAFALNKALRAKGKRMFIVVDEIDDLYRTDMTEPRRTHVKGSLGMLSLLGDQKSGLYSVFLCGSSAVTPRLISAETAHLASSFPLVATGVPNLNSTKFKRLPIASASCVDIKEVEVMVERLNTSGVLNVQQRAEFSRLLAFLVGAVPRSIGDALSSSTGAASLSATRMSELVDDLLGSSTGPGTALPEDASFLYDELLDRLVKANTELVDLLLNQADCTVNSEAVLNEPWEKKLNPLPWADAQDAWATVAARQGFAHGRDSGYLIRLLDMLSDNHKLVQRRELGEASASSWPMSVAQVVLAGPVKRKRRDGAPVPLDKWLSRVANLVTTLGGADLAMKLAAKLVAPV